MDAKIFRMRIFWNWSEDIHCPVRNRRTNCWKKRAHRRYRSFRLPLTAFGILRRAACDGRSMICK